MLTCNWCDKPVAGDSDSDSQQCNRCKAIYCCSECADASKVCRQCANSNYVKLQTHLQQQVAGLQHQLTLSTQGNNMMVLAMFTMWSHYREGLFARKVKYSDEFRACDALYQQFIQHGTLPSSIMPLYTLVIDMYKAGLHLPA